MLDDGLHLEATAGKVQTEQPLGFKLLVLDLMATNTTCQRKNERNCILRQEVKSEAYDKVLQLSKRQRRVCGQRINVAA